VSNPVVDLRPLLKPNFGICCLILFFTYGILYGVSTTLPGMLQILMGYDATTAGLVFSPAGFFAIASMLVVGWFLGKGLDARKLIGAGLCLIFLSNYWMAHLNLEISPWQVVWPRVVLIIGLSLVFAPVNVAAYLYIPIELRGAAVGLLAD